MSILTSRDGCAVTLRDETIEQNTAATCFHSDLAARKEQSSISILGPSPKQVIGGSETTLNKRIQDFSTQKNIIIVRGLLRPGIVELLQTISSSRRTFICIRTHA